MFRRSFFEILFGSFASTFSHRLKIIRDSIERVHPDREYPGLPPRKCHVFRIIPCKVCGKPSHWRSVRSGEIPSVDGERCFTTLGIQWGHNDPKTRELLEVCDEPRYKLVPIDD